MDTQDAMRPPPDPESAAGSPETRTKQARWFERHTALWRTAGACVKCGGIREGRWLRCAKCLRLHRRQYTPRMPRKPR